MLLFSVLSRLMLAVLLLLTLSNKIESAPTHHLTIGVQGNTPTLMVTSSEIGITAPATAFKKNSPKALYAAKAFKQPEVPKKFIKTNLDKNPVLNNKKDKLHYSKEIKPQFKDEPKAEREYKPAKSLGYKEHKIDTLENVKNETYLLKNEKANNLQATIGSVKVSTSAESEQSYETSLPLTTTLAPKQINEMALLTSTTRTSLEEISTLLPSATTDTFSHKYFAITDNNDLNASPAVSTTLSPKAFTTLHNDDGTNTAATPQMQTTANGPNYVVLQTHKTVQISSETSITEAASDYDSDRYTQDAIATTDNENLLLTAIETNAFTTSAPPSPPTAADISTPSTITFETNNGEATATTKEMLVLSLITTATENVADDDNNNGNSQGEQQQPLAINRTYKDKNVSVASVPEDGDAKEADNPIKQKYQKDNVLIEDKQVHTSTKLQAQQFSDGDKSSENPLEMTTEQSYQAASLNATGNKLTKNRFEIVSNTSWEATTSKQHLVATENEQSHLSIFKEKTEFPKATEIPAAVGETATTTEAILKLIDLEKHVVKSIAELKQPSLLMTAQHDNGHDGLKTTKKKQLFDKHYVEALLHQKKEDVQRKNSKDSSSTNCSQSSLKGHVTLQKTVEHGSLGPILMQEKIFHVMHQNDNSQKVKKHFKEDINNQLRRRHFVELKAQPAANENEDITDSKASPLAELTRTEPTDKQNSNNVLSRKEPNFQPNSSKNNSNDVKGVDQQDMNDKGLKNASTFQKHVNTSKNTANDNKQNKNIMASKVGSKEHEAYNMQAGQPLDQPHINQTEESKAEQSLKDETISELKDETSKEKTSISIPLLKFVGIPEHSNLNRKQPDPKSLVAHDSDNDKPKSMKDDKGNLTTMNTQSHQPIYKTLYNEGQGRLMYAEDVKLDKNAKQLVNDPTGETASDEGEQPRKSEILFETKKPIKIEKTNKQIRKSTTIAEPKFKLEKTPYEQPQQLGSQISSQDNAKLNHNTDIKEKTQENPKIFDKDLQPSSTVKLHSSEGNAQSSVVLSTTVFQVVDAAATKTPIVQAETLFAAQNKENLQPPAEEQPIESKISDIQIEVYDSTIESMQTFTNVKENEAKQHITLQQNDDSYLGKTTKPPIAALQQERFTQYVIDRIETSTHEPINYNTIKVVAGKPEPAAIEIHINVSESFGNESEDLEFSYPQSEYGNSQQSEKAGEESYDDHKLSDNIKLKIPSNVNGNIKDLRNDEILVVEIIDTENNTSGTSPSGKTKVADELFITEVKHVYTTPPPPPPPPPYQTNFDRDSDTIFYISNTEVKVGESLPSAKNTNEERKLKLESQFFPANYMASTHPNLNNNDDTNPRANHHLYEEDIIVSSNRNQADSLKIYRNNNEPSPPLDVTYVGESIIEVEQSPDAVATTTYAPDQPHNVMVGVATPQADVVIQPAILPEISIGVPVIGELPPQIELKEIDFMPNEAQLRRSGIYDDNDNNNNNNNDIDDNTITGSSSSSRGSSNNNHDVDIASGNQHIDESSIQYGGDLIDESADGGFDGVEGSYPFGNPALVKKSFLSSSSSSSHPSAFLTKLQKHQQQQQQHQHQQRPNHVADYAHLYVNYGVNNMRKDELTADVKDSGEMFLYGDVGNGNTNVASYEQNTTSFKDFLSKVSMSNATAPLATANATQTERMSNATAFSVMEDTNDLEDRNTENIINLVSLAIGLFIVILPVVVTCSMFWALRYLYKKYHSNVADNGGGYDDHNERKVPLTDDGAEKGEFVHETSSSPTYSHKDTIQNYPDTSNKPSTTDSRVKFSSEKPTPNIETSSSISNTNASLAANYPSALASQNKEDLKLSLALSSPIAQKFAKPLPTASSPPSKSTASEQTHYKHDDIFSEERDDDDVEMPGPNGSITKMTLENNLLIVETEERNDISRVARETKMDYNKDGVFVVEVARGIDSKAIPESPVAEGNEKMLSMFETKQNNGGLVYKITNEKNCSNNEKVQIHSPPPENQEEGPRSLHQIEEVDEPVNSPQLNEAKVVDIGLAYKANTGLSQSDLSTTSSNDSNKGYCYGNQELYVVEQKGYSPVARNGNVTLKCDVKDLKDDDRNPENDHYLKHSPNRMEDLSKNKEDVVGTTKAAGEGETRTSSGESPEQKQNDQIQSKNESNDNKAGANCLQTLERLENDSNRNDNKIIENTLEGVDNEIENGIEIRHEEDRKTPDNPIPVEIEVHIIPAQIEDPAEDESLPSYETAVEQQFTLKNKYVSQSPITENVHEVLPDSSESKSLALENNATEINVCADVDNESAQDRSNAGIEAEEEEEEKENNENISIHHPYTTKEDPVLETKNEKGEQEQNQKDEINPEDEKPLDKSCNGLEEEKEELLVQQITVVEAMHDQLEDIKSQNDEGAPETESLKTQFNSLELNGVHENEEQQQINVADVNGLIHNGTLVDETQFVEGLSNGLIKDVSNGATEPELTDTEPRLKKLLNGHADPDSKHNSLNEIENGYDSIMSLPEPPPTTDEQLNSDLSEHQLDSLPPPPPPEVFSLKDLPPPLTNGNVDSPQSEESNSFYSTLPPPPPTSLEVTASAETTTTTNGKVHASPLTPPASPPAHFTNNLHVGLCSQPIAVDVNGS